MFGKMKLGKRMHAKAKPVMIAAGVAAIPSALALLFVMPLIGSGAYEVSVSYLGKPLNTRLYRPLISWNYYIIHTESLNGQKGYRYQWMAISFNRNAIIAGVPVRAIGDGLFYVHTDQFVGLNVTDPKLEDTWQASFPKGGATFSNESLNFTLKEP